MVERDERIAERIAIVMESLADTAANLRRATQIAMCEMRYQRDGARCTCGTGHGRRA